MREIVITYSIIAFYYCLYQIAVYNSAKTKSSQIIDVLRGKGVPGVLLSRLLAGIFFLGMAIVHISSIRENRIDFLDLTGQESSFIPLLVAVAITSAGGLIVGIRSRIVSTLSSFNAFSDYFFPVFVLLRIFFLIVYECFFRGVLLFILLEDTNLIAAFTLTTTLYVFNHWYQKKERLGAMILGLLFCGLTVYYQSVWPAIYVHLFMALIAEITQIKRFKSSIKISGI